MADRQGIEIDYCPDCRGVWLDRGELDKIIERASNDASPSIGNPAPRPMRRDDSDEYERTRAMKYPKKKDDRSSRRHLRLLKSASFG